MVDDAIVSGDVHVLEGRIEAVGLQPAGRAGLAIPGLVDLQVNGHEGVDLVTSDDDGWGVVGTSLARGGVTSYLANLITGPEPSTRAAVSTAARMMRSPAPDSARLQGVHLEGPFLSVDRRGTHPTEFLRPPSNSFLSAIGGGIHVVRAITLAPELPGTMTLISELARAGVLVSLGHSNCDAATAHAAFDAGARTVTHVFNAMTAPTAREPGLAGVALTRPDVFPQLICDGAHVADDVVRLVTSAAADRFILTSDAISGASAGDGTYRFGTFDYQVADGRAVRADGTLVGSTSSLADCLRHAVAVGVDPLNAVSAATTRPASLLGMTDRRLRPGDVADVVVLNDNFDVSCVLIDGVETT